MLIVYPTNVDYLLDDVRIRIGDVDGKSYSDAYVRTAILGGVKMLQKRWGNRYLIFEDGTRYDPLPTGVFYAGEYDATIHGSYSYIVPSGYWFVRTPNGDGIAPSGLRPNDVFRNPYQTFISTGLNPISQEDEYAVILAASITMSRTRLTSNADSFMSWSDGEYSFSNIQGSRVLEGMFKGDLEELDALFKKRLASGLRSSFDGNMLVRY